MSSIFSISFSLFSIVMLLDVLDVVVVLWLVVGMSVVILVVMGVVLVVGMGVVLVVGMGVVLIVSVGIVLVVCIGVLLVVRQVGHVYLKAIDCINAINSFEGEFLLPHCIDISFAG